MNNSLKILNALNQKGETEQKNQAGSTVNNMLSFKSCIDKEIYSNKKQGEQKGNFLPVDLGKKQPRNSNISGQTESQNVITSSGKIVAKEGPASKDKAAIQKHNKQDQNHIQNTHKSNSKNTTNNSDTISDSDQKSQNADNNSKVQNISTS